MKTFLFIEYYNLEVKNCAQQTVPSVQGNFSILITLVRHSLIGTHCPPAVMHSLRRPQTPKQFFLYFTQIFTINYLL